MLSLVENRGYLATYHVALFDSLYEITQRVVACWVVPMDQQTLPWT